MEEKKNVNQISIELKEDVAQGIYSNLAVITHSSSEFVIDFVRVMPGMPKGRSEIEDHPYTGTCQTISDGTER